MGIVEQVKKITKWESAVVVMFTIACIFGTIVLGAIYSIEILYIGALIALGIPTSFLGNVTSRAVVAANSPSTSTSTLKESEVQKRLDKQDIVIANMSNEYANLRSQYEVVRSALLSKEIETICMEEKEDV